MIPLIITYSITIVGAVSGLFVPLYGLFAYMCLSMLRPADLWEGSVPEGNYSRIVAICVILGWLFQGCGNFRFGRARPIFWCLGGYWVWAIISAFFAEYRSFAWISVDTRSKIILPVIIGFTLIDSMQKLRLLAWVLVGSQALIAFAGHYSAYVFNQENWLMTQGLGGYDNNDTAAGMVMICGVAFMMGLSETGWRKWLALGCAGLMFNAAILSYSRGALLGLFVIAAITLLLNRKEPRHHWILILALIVSLKFFGPYARERAAQIVFKGRDSIADNSAESRLKYWKQGIQWMLDNPVVGIGPGNFLPRAANVYGRTRAAHSIWISTGAELGLPGLLLLIGTYGFTIREAWRLARRSTYPESSGRDIGRMALLGIPGFLVCATFLSIWGLEQAYFLILLVGGAVTLTSFESPQMELRVQT